MKWFPGFTELVQVVSRNRFEGYVPNRQLIAGLDCLDLSYLHAREFFLAGGNRDDGRLVRRNLLDIVEGEMVEMLVTDQKNVRLVRNRAYFKGVNDNGLTVLNSERIVPEPTDLNPLLLEQSVSQFPNLRLHDN